MGLKTLWVKIKGDNSGLKKSLKDSEKDVSGFGGVIKKLGPLVAGAFSVGKLIQFGKEAVNVAARAEGIRDAFKRLNDPALLDELRRATRGTVDDVLLMQKAVQAKNFNLPLEQLGTLFEFATKRAQQTGESVDYLVDSIVTGIARKSIPIMDNLGISSVQLQQEMARVGDFTIAAGNIVKRELEAMGDVADTTATKFAKISAAWKNITEGAGGKIIGSGPFDTMVKFLEDVAKISQGGSVGMFLTGVFSPVGRKAIIEEMDKSQTVIAEKTKELREAQTKAASLRAKNDARELEAQQKKSERRISILAEAGKYEADLLAKQAELDEAIKTGGLVAINALIAKTQEEIEKTDESKIGRLIELYQELARLEGRKGAIEALATPADKLETKTPDKKTGGFNIVGEVIAPGMGDIQKAAVDTTKNLLIETQKWSEMLYQFDDMTKDWAASVVESFAFALGSGQMDEFGKQFLAGMGDLLSQFGKMLIALALAEAAFLESLVNPATWPVALAAGIAMVAIGGAIKGALSNAGSSMSGGGSAGGSYGSSSAGNSSLQNLTIEIKGVLKGSDIAISSKRYSNSLNSVT